MFVSIAVMTRMLDFYPIYAAVWTLSAALSALSIKKMNPIWASIGAGLALLMDPRGLVWALCALAIALGVSLRQRKWLHLTALIPLLCSYGIANHIVPADSPSLELQAWWFAQERAGVFNPAPMSWAHETFVWGHSLFWTSQRAFGRSCHSLALRFWQTTSEVGSRAMICLAQSHAHWGALRLAASKLRPSQNSIDVNASCDPFCACACKQAPAKSLSVVLLGLAFCACLVGICLNDVVSHRNRPWVPLRACFVVCGL